MVRMALLCCGSVACLATLWLTSALNPKVESERFMVMREVRQAEAGDGVLSFELSPAEASAGEWQAPERARTEKLSEGETAAVLDRLPEMAEPPQTTDFALRPSSKPAPRPGSTHALPFPLADSSKPQAEPEAGTLEVVRFAPSGEVELAANINITFSRPMVALTSHTELRKDALPLSLEPQPAGKWRWVGSKTLVFDGKTRLPMATRFEVAVKPDSTAVDGSRLKGPVFWSFSTPPVQVVSFLPDESQTQPREPLILLIFNQKIEPAAILERLHLKGSGSSFALRQATAEEVAADPQISARTKNLDENLWLVVKPKTALPNATRFELTAGPNLPSAEGPLTSQKAFTFAFQTYGAMKVTGSRCGYNNQCRPGTSFEVAFSNPLDPIITDMNWVTAAPAIPQMTVFASGNTLYINGHTQANTAYEVTLSAEIGDQFGQKLNEEKKFTFKVGDAYPMLFWQLQPVTLLDPYSPPTITIYSVEHKSFQLQVYSVQPGQFGEYWRFMGRDPYSKNADLAGLPGEKVIDEKVTIANKPGEMVETRIPLARALKDGRGQLIVRIVPEEQKESGKFQRTRHVNALSAWIQATQIGLDALVDNRTMLIWANRLKDGKALKDLKVEVFANDGKFRATATPRLDGLYTLELPEKETAPLIISASDGRDVCLLEESTWFYQGQVSSWRRRDPGETLTFFVADDRQMYKPGETVSLKGWARWLKSAADPRIPDPKTGEFYFRAFDSRENKYAEGKVESTPLGGFDFSFAVPDGVNLGPSRIEILDSQKTYSAHTHQVQIQEFRRPEYEVTVSADPGPYFFGGQGVAEVSASYFAGGGLPQAPVRWSVTATTAGYTPPNQGDFVFGQWIPWWIRNTAPATETRFRSLEGFTDSSGVHRLRVDFLAAQPPLPATLSLEAAVRDVNSQEWSGSTQILVHPAEYYVGLRTQKQFVNKGTPFSVEAVVADIEGNRIEGAVVEVLVTRMVWTSGRNGWREEEKDLQEYEVRSGKAPVSFKFETAEGGRYVIAARVQDPAGRASETRLSRWVSGGTVKPAQRVEQEQVELIPNQRDYKPGDTAELLVRAPFFPAEGLVTIHQGNILETKRFQMPGPDYVLKVPVRASYLPSFSVRIDLNGSAPRSDSSGAKDPALPDRPATATGSITLTVPPRERQLDLKIEPASKELAPASQTSVSVIVSNAAGQPLADAEVALFVVDEAVLALSNYQLGDPLTRFYPDPPSDLSEFHVRPKVLLEDPDKLLERAGDAAGGVSERTMDSVEEGLPAQRGRMTKMAAAPSMVLASAEPILDDSRPSPIAVRSDFNPLAVFIPAARTNGDGRVSLTFKLPDNLTRYRVMVLAVSGATLFGSGESQITARLPLMVRPSAPRFLNFGDQFELPVVVQNQTDESLHVRLAARAQNASFTDGAGRSFQVPAHDRVEVLLPAATERAGTARFQFGVVSGDSADAAEISLPVWTPATSEAFATYGELDKGAVQYTVRAPGEVFAQFGGLEVSTSSTALAGLTDAVLYLSGYPYECSEQLASRILAVTALRDALQAFGADFDPVELDGKINRDLERLARLQNPDGGYGFWRSGEKSWPFISVHVAHALARARQKDYVVSASCLQRAQNYLSRIDRGFEDFYGPQMRFSIRAYALHVRRILGTSDTAEARRVFQTLALDKAPLEGLAWLLPLFDPQSSERKAILRHFNNRVSETAAAASFAESYGDNAYLILHSQRRTDATILESLIETVPDHDLIPKIIHGLDSHRVKGRWDNTQENVFVLLAMDRYFRKYENKTPDFLASLWLDGHFAGEQRFAGRSGDRNQLDIPMAWLAKGSAGGSSGKSAQDMPLVVAKEGAGRLYYRLGLKYAPKNLKLDPEEQGFFVERRYAGVDDQGDVIENADGSYTVKRGARIKVTLTMVAPSRRYHVALVDPVPAGFEIINGALATSQAPPPDPVAPYWRGWWIRPWYEHQNLRDERAEAFASLVQPGVYEFSYSVRATTPGEFIVPPLKAEEMYHPETFGRGASTRVTVR